MMETGDGGEYDAANAYPDGLPEVWRWEAGDDAASSSAPTRGGGASPSVEIDIEPLTGDVARFEVLA